MNTNLLKLNKLICVTIGDIEGIGIHLLLKEFKKEKIKDFILITNINIFNEWYDFCKMVVSEIPLIEDSANKKHKRFVNPYEFYNKLSDMCKSTDVIVPCSSGGALTTFYQTFKQKQNQIIISNKGLAAMGYGLSGAIGASFASKTKRVIFPLLPQKKPR